VESIVEFSSRDDDEISTRKGKECSGQRQSTEICTGKGLGVQNSFKACKDRFGKCCANKDSSGGLDINNENLSREDCGYCFTKKCKG